MVFHSCLPYVYSSYFSMVFYTWFYCERAWCRNCQPGRYASSQSALPEAEVLDTIYQYADTPTARTAHDFRVASALGGDALIKALEKMEEMPEAQKRESWWSWMEVVLKDWNGRKKLNGFVDIRCVSKVDILGHEHWHSRKEEDGVFIQTHVIWSIISTCCLITSWLQQIRRIQSLPPFFDFDPIQKHQNSQHQWRSMFIHWI